MTQRGYPFDSVQMGEAEWSIMFRNMLSDGVITGELNQLEVYGDSTGMQVKARTGRAWIRGHLYENDAEVTLTIAAAHASNPRIDRAILRLDWTANTILLAILTGTAAATPIAPALTQNASVWEIPLATVAVAAQVSTITSGNVVTTGQRQFAAARFILATTGAIFAPFHAGSDGVGSGLDADLFDGLNANQFVRSDIAQTIAPLWNFTTPPTIAGAQIWHAGNDGPVSGLDADTVDGSHATSFATAGHTHPHSHAEYLPLTGGTVSGVLVLDSTLHLSGPLHIDQAEGALYTAGNVNINNQTGSRIIVKNQSGTTIGYIGLFNAA